MLTTGGPKRGQLKSRSSTCSLPKKFLLHHFQMTVHQMICQILEEASQMLNTRSEVEIMSKAVRNVYI